MSEDAVYPFSAIVGQDTMRLALTLAAIHPGLGGVLIRGSKGAAKSTAVRGLAGLLPEVEVFASDPFHRAPGEDVEGWPLDDRQPQSRPVRLVNLPIGATDDRVVGSLDIEAALGSGRSRFQPGILADAHRGILYIDEVNLLADHLVDLLLDAAAMGVNHVEREGLAFRHPSRFVLIGTMNPEEGELRPQFLDRFGLAVETSEMGDPKDRAEVVRRRLAFEADPAAFARRWEDAEQVERGRIGSARRLLPSVTASDALIDAICELCVREGAEGLRADLTIYKAASALAAYRGKDVVTLEDMNEVAPLALLHRRTTPPRKPPPPDDRPTPRDRPFHAQGGRSPDAPRNAGESILGEKEAAGHVAGPSDEDISHPAPAGDQIIAPRWNPDDFASRRLRSPGRRGRPSASDRRGAFLGAVAARGRTGDVAIAATLRASAPWQVHRGRLDCFDPLILRPWDLREKARRLPIHHLILFCVDASRSMGSHERMGRTKAAVLSLLLDAYQKRNRVGLIAFGKGGAHLVLPPTRSVRVAARLLDDVPVGGATSLPAGLAMALRVISAERRRAPGITPLVVLLTDGRGNLPLVVGGDPEAEALALAGHLGREDVGGLVIDTEAGPVRLGLARRLAEAWGVDCRGLDGLESRGLNESIRRTLFSMPA